MYMWHLIIVRPHNYGDKQARLVKQSLTFWLIDRPSFATDRKLILCSHVSIPIPLLVHPPKCLSLLLAPKVNIDSMWPQISLGS